MPFQRVSMCAFVCTQRELDWDWCWKSGSFERMEHTEETPWINQTMSSGDGGNGKGKERRVWGACLNTAELCGISLRTLCSDKELRKADWAGYQFANRAIITLCPFGFFNFNLLARRPQSSRLVFKHTSALRMSKTLTCSHLWDTTTVCSVSRSLKQWRHGQKKKNCCLSSSLWFVPVFWDGSNSHPGETEFSRRCKLKRTITAFSSAVYLDIRLQSG